MSERVARWVAWPLFALFITLASAGLVLQMQNDLALLRENPGAFVENLWLFLVFSTYGVVGAFVAARRPNNPIGWIFLAISMLTGLAFFSEQYAIYALVTNPGSLPAAEFIAWPSFWMWVTGVGLLITFLPLLFPTGHLPSRRWQGVAWLATSLIILLSAYLALTPEPHEHHPIIRNPVGLEALRGLYGLEALMFWIIAICALICAASLIVRFRYAQAVERQQLKWFMYASTLLAIAVLFDNLELHPFLNLVSNLLFLFALAAIPVAMGIAILRYRLWDIDVIIRRTLIYGVLTGALALVYFGSVVLLQGLFRTLTGQASQLAIVVSTLAIAGLFHPLRHRIQAVIDRRFYRRKYDAAQTLAAFSTTVRDEVDLDRLTAELLRVVEETMQPAQVSLWLRKPERKA